MMELQHVDNDRRQLSPSVGHGCCKIHLHVQGPFDKKDVKICSSLGRDLTYLETAEHSEEAQEVFVE